MKRVRYQRSSQQGEGLVLCIYPIVTQGQGRKFMSFVNSFLIPQRISQTQRIFLYRISKDSLRTLNRMHAEWIQRFRRDSAGYFTINQAQIPRDSHVSATCKYISQKLPIKMPIFKKVNKKVVERCIWMESAEIQWSQPAMHEMSRRIVTVLKVSTQY